MEKRKTRHGFYIFSCQQAGGWSPPARLESWCYQLLDYLYWFLLWGNQLASNKTQDNERHNNRMVQKSTGMTKRQDEPLRTAEKIIIRAGSLDMHNTTCVGTEEGGACFCWWAVTLEFTPPCFKSCQTCRKPSRRQTGTFRHKYMHSFFIHKTSPIF